MTRIAAFLLVALLAVGCTPRVATDPAPLPAARPAGWTYIIAPGDDLDVRFFYNPELNEEVAVRPDGNISLPLAGEVRAAGLTPTQLEGELKKRYGGELRQTAITVIVKGFAGQRVYVDGEVGAPKMVNIAGNLSALQAVASAGGFKPSARKSQVLVIRRTGTARPEVISLDLEAALRGSDTVQDIQLEPYDIVYVPQSAIGEVNDWVDQYIRKNIPLPFGLGYGL